MFYPFVAGTSIRRRASGATSLLLFYRKQTPKRPNAVALRICESVANDGKGPKLSISVGIAIYPQTW